MSADRRGASRVLVVGDANPDLVLTGDVRPRFGQAEQLLDEATLTIGGSAAITAHAFARLGRPVSLVAAVGRDTFGDRICADLAAAGVGVEHVLRREDTATGLTVVLSEPEDRAILTYPGAITTLTVSEIRRAVAALDGGPDPVRHVHVSALYLQPQLVEELPALLAELRSAGISTSLDTNDDPTRAWAGVARLVASVDLLLPNGPEAIALAMAAGVAVDPDRAGAAATAAAGLAALGPTVVVKEGARGAFARLPSGALVTATAQPCRPVDTTGAGDTFDAAFIDAWLSGRPESSALRRAVVAGARAVSAVGGTAGQPTAAELDHDAPLDQLPADQNQVEPHPVEPHPVEPHPVEPLPVHEIAGAAMAPTHTGDES